MLAIIGGALLIAATPVTLLIVGLLSPVILDLLLSFGLCGVCVHVICGVFAVKFGMEAMKGRAKEGGLLIAAGIVAIAGAIFLLGGLLGFLAGILLLVAGAMTYSS